MKKFLILILFLSLSLSGCNSNTSDKSDMQEQNTNYNISRINTESNESNTNNITTVNPETDISSFSTKIYTPNDTARQTNIRLTCSKLNETVVKSGDTFSFCNTVGKATPEEGYQKADIFDKDGNIIKGYGGGNCQISSTLYNAVLNLPSLVVTERHEHSKDVYYVPKGKDAAVAYGSIDFKFRNDYDYDIKIYSSSDSNNIYVRIVKL